MNLPTFPQNVPGALPLLAGKKGLVVGIANGQSIAHGCAQAMQRMAKLAEPLMTDGGTLVTMSYFGAVTAMLCSDAARALTGNVTYVDAGYHVMG